MYTTDSNRPEKKDQLQMLKPICILHGEAFYKTFTHILWLVSLNGASMCSG